jgi:hypothetical protein
MTRNRKIRCCCAAIVLLSMTLIAAESAFAATAEPAAAARLATYLMAGEMREVTLARSAAPPSVSAHATVMVLRSRGYVVAAQGDNGFVCLVARSWDYSPRARGALFWNPRFRAPYCFNPAAQRSVLRVYLMKTRWVLAGASRRAIGDRERAAWSEGRIKEPLRGAMSYMMSRRGRWIGGEPGPWRPHLMFYFPRGRTRSWGANLPGNPVSVHMGKHITIIIVLVPDWSDGSQAPVFR